MPSPQATADASYLLNVTTDLARNAAVIEPETTTLDVKAVRRNGGGYYIADLGTRTFQIGVAPRPINPKFPKVKIDGDTLVTAFGTPDGEMLHKLSDGDLEAALLTWAEQHQPSPQACRVASQAVMLYTLLRRGVLAEGLDVT